MKRIVAILLSTLALCAIGNARADWQQMGVAARCDVHKQEFSLLPVSDGAYPSDRIATPAGAYQLSMGQDQDVVCVLGNTRVRVNLDVRPAQPFKGQGIGVIVVNGLWLNERRILDRAHAFNMEDHGLREIIVRAVPSEPVVLLCESDLGSLPPYENRRCVPAGFTGQWVADLRTHEERARDVDCGTAKLVLQQVGDDLTGSADLATAECGRVDEGAEVRGIVSAETAVILIRSARNGAVVVGTLTPRHDGNLQWQLQMQVLNGDPEGDDVFRENATFSPDIDP